MKKFYDKLLLLLAFLALLGGVVFYMLKIDGAPVPGSSADIQAADNPYDPVPIPSPTEEQASWPEPGHQSSGPNWLYDVFTPPKIYIDRDGNFSAEPPVGIQDKPEPFGIYLAELNRKPYRIQMQGFSGDRNKPEEAVLFFFDEERQVRFFIREGQTNEESEVEVLDFMIERVIDAEEGSATMTAIVTILDKRSGEEIKLNDDERLMDPEIVVIFRSNEDPEVEVELLVDPENPVTTFATTTGEFTLQKINLEDRSVTVEKKATELSETRNRTLSALTLEQPQETESTESEEESEVPASDELDFNFDI